jgi:putative tricarboxylic transport membrane protein
MRVNDSLAGLLLILLAGAVIAYTFTFPAFPGQRFGPALFPRVLATGLILCGLLLIARERAAAGPRRPMLAFDGWTREPGRLASFALIPAAVLFYILVAESLGFLPTAFLILAVLLLWFGVDWGLGLAIAAALTFFIQFFFGALMRVPLPRGLAGPLSDAIGRLW